MSLFSTTYDIIIVGGGISGLFLAYKLSDTNLEILLIEKDKDLGGRVHTATDNDIQYEAGAGRFNEKHTKLISLINELNLEGNMITLSNDQGIKVREYDTKKTLNTHYLFNVLKKKYLKYESSYLQKITFYQLLIDIFDYETANYIKDTFGYDAEFLDLNADAAFIMFKDDLFSDTEYYVLKGGLSEIMTKMESCLKNRENVTILKKNELKQIFDDKIVTDIDTYYYKNLVLAIPQFNLKLLTEFKDFELLDSVKPIGLLRIYAVYPLDSNGDPWFKNIKRTTTNSYLRHIIPIDNEKGLIMISYTDSFNAQLLINLYSLGEEIMMKEIHKEIKRLFNIVPPDVKKVYFHNWSNKYSGLHVWKPNNDVNKIYSKILQPDSKKNIFICGEAYSKKQGWIEGALETSYDVLKKLNLENINIKFN